MARDPSEPTEPSVGPLEAPGERRVAPPPSGARARALCAACAIAAAPAAARAQQPAAQRTAAAHALFEQGRSLMGAGRYAEACAKLEESHRVEPAPGTLLNLADCYDRIGRTASARELFLEVAALAKSARFVQRETATRESTTEAERREALARAGALEKREALARERANALEPKLSRLRVVVGAAAAGLSVQRDGIVLEASEWGAAAPVDPGQHVVEASAPNKWDYRIMRYVPPGAALVTVEVPPLLDRVGSAPQSLPPSAPAAPAAPLAPPATRPDPPSPDGAWRKPVGYATAGLGLAAAGAGIFFLGDYTFRANDPNGNYEWEKPTALYAFTGAGVLLGAGLYFLLSAPSAAKPRPTAGSIAGFAW